MEKERLLVNGKLLKKQEVDQKKNKVHETPKISLFFNFSNITLDVAKIRKIYYLILANLIF